MTVKKTFLFLALVPLAATAHADGITDGISMAGDHICSHTPYIQTICHTFKPNERCSTHNQ